jgi:DNA-binding CsgD family transcriptional regulator
MQGDPHVAGLRDQIHSAMLGRATWSSFLADARTLVPDSQAILFYRDHVSGDGSVALSAGLDAPVAEAYRAHYSRINPIRPMIATRPVGRVLSIDQMISQEALRRSEFYHDFLRPLGTKTGFGVTLLREGGASFDFALMGGALSPKDSNRVRRAIEALVPPLRQAFDCARARVSGAGRGLMAAPQFDHGGIVRIGPGAKVQSADNQTRALLDDASAVTIDRAGRLMSTQPSVTAAVAAALASSVSRAPFSRVFHLRRNEGEIALRLTVLGGANDEAAFFRGPECILILEDPDQELGAAVAWFGAMHGLTPAERGVVSDLAHGLSPCRIAAARGIAVDTVRGHFKSIYLRTGLKRQADLVRHVCLLSGGACAPAPANAPFASALPPPAASQV